MKGTKGKAAARGPKEALKPVDDRSVCVSMSWHLCFVMH